MVWASAVALAVAAEWVAFSWDEPTSWVPDFVVGLTFVACGSVAWSHRHARGAAALLTATGFTWFFGNFGEAALYLHRGVLVHLLLAYPGWRPRTRLDVLAIGAGYVAALATPIWGSDWATVGLAVGLVAVAGRGYSLAAGRARGERLVALQAASALGVVLAGSAVARLAFPAGDAADPTLFVYQATLCALAVALLARLGGPTGPGVADLVVELGETRAGTLRDRLARALGDPSLQIGYWSLETGSYVDDAGRTVALGVEDGRSATRVEREGRPFAVLVHDAAVLDDPALVEAVSSATRLSASNAALNAEVRVQAAEFTSSRRRLLVAADEERRRLEARLREGPGRRLATLEAMLARVPPTSGGEAVARARTQLSRTAEALGELASGLHPGELTETGLGGALTALAARTPVLVELEVQVERAPDEIEAAVYFVCAEALANIAKHASASRVEVEVATRDDLLSLVVADDGVGGADPARGTGLLGLADRVEALGGTLQVTSPLGAGTRLVAEIPLDDELG